MESKSSPSPSSSSASRPSSDAAPRPGSAADWQPSSGLMDRMLAYSHWWNIPDGRSRRGTRSRAGTARNRAAGRAG